MSFTKFVLVIVLLLPATVAGQGRKEANEATSVGGITVTHGMSLDTAQKRLTGAGFDLLKLDDNAVSVLDKSTMETADLTFRDGKLIGVTKQWLTAKPTAETMFNTLYGLVEKFAKEGRGLCSIRAFSTSSPTRSARSVLMKCGETESIDISVSSFTYLENGAPVFGINENIFWETPQAN